MSTPPRPFIVRFTSTIVGECRIVCQPAERQVFRSTNADERDLEPAVPAHWKSWVNSAIRGYPRPGVNTYVTDVVVECRGVDKLGVEQWVPCQGSQVGVIMPAIIAAVLGQLGLEAGASEIDLGNVVC